MKGFAGAKVAPIVASIAAIILFAGMTLRAQAQLQPVPTQPASAVSPCFHRGGNGRLSFIVARPSFWLGGRNLLDSFELLAVLHRTHAMPARSQPKCLLDGQRFVFSGYICRTICCAAVRQSCPDSKRRQFNCSITSCGWRVARYCIASPSGSNRCDSGSDSRHGSSHEPGRDGDSQLPAGQPLPDYVGSYQRDGVREHQ